MAENYSHWRAMTNMDYLRAEMLSPGEEKVLTIKEVKQENISNTNGEVEPRPVLHFEEDILPMVLNVTNCKTIEKLYETGNIFEWVGKKVQIFATCVRVGKETVPCLRIRNFIPKTNEVEYKCAVCGKNITKDYYDKSVAKHGKAYCSKECYEKDINGEQLL